MGEINTLELSILPKEHQELAEFLGIEVFYKLCEYYGGTRLYIPKQESISRHLRDAEIKKLFNGSNYKELARQYKLTENYIRKIIGNPSKSLQTTIFDLE